MPEPDTVTIQRAAGAVAFDALIKQRGLSPRGAAIDLNAFARGSRFPGEPVTIAHPMIIDWRTGRKRPNERHQSLIRLWAQERDRVTDAITNDPIPETMWTLPGHRPAA